MTTPTNPSADKATAAPDAGERVTPEEAFMNYSSAVEAREARLNQLLSELLPDAGVMRVLYMAYLDLGGSAIYERCDPDDIQEAKARGWVAGRRLVLTEDGLTAWWLWKEQVTPHTRDVGFQLLWRDVIAW
jgi:hypothetical protein